MLRQTRACGFLSKAITKGSFLNALEQVALHGYYHAHSEELGKAELVDRRSEALDKLTPRELEFISLLCQNGDLTNEQLADRMQLHRRTIDGYMQAAYRKCDVHSKTGLVAFAYKLGVVP